MRAILLTAALVFFGCIPVAYAQAPVVVELFTSQSCSSCPPADRILGELVHKPEIIALSCNVTYWNHLHWKDTLSREFCTERQRDYSRKLGKRGPYTPQMIINGEYDVVGNQEHKVKSTVANARPVQEIVIRPETGQLRLVLPSINADSYHLTLFAYNSSYTQDIPSGENRGRTVTYTNPVTDEYDLGQWDGDMTSVFFETNESSKPTGGYIVLAQDKKGKIIAAGELKI